MITLTLLTLVKLPVKILCVSVCKEKEGEGEKDLQHRGHFNDSGFPGGPTDPAGL